MKKSLWLILITAFCWGCSSKPATEKHQGKRDNIINVHDRIKEIVVEDLLLSSYSLPQLVDKYLFIKEHQSETEFIHIFDKDNFGYITSTGRKGLGPGEIARIAYVVEDKANRKFYATDEGKYKILSYDLDSVIADPAYRPVEKMKLSKQLIPWDYVYINDTLSIGVIFEPIGTNNFIPVIGKINMKTGEIKRMNYRIHPDVKKKRIYFGISVEHGIYVECYIPHDLMTICSLDGELKYTIYGPDWDTETHSTDHYGDVEFCGDRIVALYSGEKSFTKDLRSNWPTRFLVFDLEGNYLKTLETGYKVAEFCYDKDNHRFIMNMDDDIQFGYMEVGDLLD